MNTKEETKHERGTHASQPAAVAYLSSFILAQFP